MSKGNIQIFSLLFWLEIFKTFLNTCKRFPISIIALIALNVVTLSKLHELEFLTERQTFYAYLFAAGAAFWFAATTLLTESMQWNKTKHYSISIPLYLLYCWHVTSFDSWELSIGLLILSAALFITFAAWLFRTGDNDSVWYFNYQLLAAISFALLTAIILCGGVSLILASIDYLFDVEITSRYYGDTWLIGMTFLAPVYFLANVSKQYYFPKEECSFPNGITFILTYVLVPLALIYMVILYAYFIKITLSGSLPRGNLGSMISAFGVIGIISHLAIYPIYNKNNAILSLFYRYFYLIMIVPLALLILAISERIIQYGLTESRYLVIICAVWFSFLMLAFFLKRQQFKIKIVTLSLALLTMLASFGPWGIHQLPVNSQFSRLESMLIKENLLINGALKVDNQPDFDSRKSISSMVDYLVTHSAGTKLRPWISDKEAFDKLLADYEEKPNNYFSGTEIVKLMGIDYVSRWSNPNDNSLEITVKTDSDYHEFFNVADYDLLVPISWMGQDSHFKVIIESNDNQVVELVISINEEGHLQVKDAETLLFTFDLYGFANQYTDSDFIKLDANDMLLTQAGDHFNAKLMLKRLSITNIEGVYSNLTLSGNLLVGINDDIK